MKRPWRRRRREPDKRLDWRDPDMPVLRAMTTGMEEMSPEDESEYSRMVMRKSVEPEWKKDPTYDLAKRKRGFVDKVKEAMIMAETKYDPLVLAREHQASIKKLIERELADAACIRCLLVGKTVATDAGSFDEKKFLVTEVRLGLGGTVMLHGKKVGSKRTVTIGTVYVIKVVEPVT